VNYIYITSYPHCETATGKHVRYRSRTVRNSSPRSLTLSLCALRS